MALKEQDVVLYSTDTDGNKVIQMPITRVENVEGAVKTVDGVAPDENGNIPTGDKVTSINGKTGAVTIDTGIGRGVGRGGLNVSFNVKSYNTYTVPSSGIISISCSCGHDGVDVYFDGTKLFTEPYTKTWQEDDGGEAGSGTTAYSTSFTIPVNANEVIGIVLKGKDYNRLHNNLYAERLPFNGTLMQLAVV